MSAPPSEAGSEFGEVVIIDIKVEGSEGAAGKYDPSDDYSVFASECLVEIEKKWLASEFFQAPMKRWKFDENSQTRLTLLLPEGCVACEGARLLKLRLGSEYIRRKSEPASSTKDRAWSPVDWWKATSGRSTSLFGALHLFNFTLQKDFAVEVAETLKLYGWRCPLWVAAIAQELEVEVVESLPPFEPLDVPFDIFKKLLKHALDNDTNYDYKIMVHKALATDNYPPQEIMEVVVQAWLALIQWETDVQKVTDDQAAVDPVIGRPIRDNKSLPWLHVLLRELVHQHPDTAHTCHTALFAAFKATRGRYTVHRLNTSNNQTSVETPFVRVHLDQADRLRAECSHSLLVKASLDWSSTENAFTKFCNVSCKASRYTFVDGSGMDTRPFIDLEVFAIAPLAAQKIWFEASPKEFCAEFKNQVHLAHPGVRHLLLENAPLLSNSDIKFLTTASFSAPALGEEGGHWSMTPPKIKRKRVL